MIETDTGLFKPNLTKYIDPTIVFSFSWTIKIWEWSLSFYCKLKKPYFWNLATLIFDIWLALWEVSIHIFCGKRKIKFSLKIFKCEKFGKHWNTENMCIMLMFNVESYAHAVFLQTLWYKQIIIHLWSFVCVCQSILPSHFVHAPHRKNVQIYDIYIFCFIQPTYKNKLEYVCKCMCLLTFVHKNNVTIQTVLNT